MWSYFQSLHYFKFWSNMLHVSHFAVLTCSGSLTILNCLHMQECNGNDLTGKFCKKKKVFWSLSMPLFTIGLLVCIFIEKTFQFLHIIRNLHQVKKCSCNLPMTSSKCHKTAWDIMKCHHRLFSCEWHPKTIYPCPLLPATYLLPCSSAIMPGKQSTSL